MKHNFLKKKKNYKIVINTWFTGLNIAIHIMMKMAEENYSMAMEDQNYINTKLIVVSKVSIKIKITRSTKL